MAEEKNIYLVRLNKLYHFLNDQDATVKIRHTNNGQQDSTKYSADSKEYSLKDLFSHGCEVSGRALKSITGNRSYIESKEIGRYKSITEQQKEVIKSIQYNFKNDITEPSVLKEFSESKKDLFLKENFSYYGFTNLCKTYPSVVEIQNSIYKMVKNDFDLIDMSEDEEPEPGFKINWSLGQLKDYFYMDETIRLINPSVKNKLEEIIAYRDQYFTSRNESSDSLDHMKLIMNGTKEYCRALEEYPPSSSYFQDFNQDELDNVIYQLSLKETWISRGMYSLMHRFLQMRKTHKHIELPDNIHALTLLIAAEIQVIQDWMCSTSLAETFNNIEYSVRYSSESGKGEYLLKRGLTVEDLSIILEDFNFEMHPLEAFHVKNNSILNFPLYRYGSEMGTDFLYDKSEFEYAVLINLFNYFYSELMKHFYLSNKIDQKIKNNAFRTIREILVHKNRP